MSYSSIKKKFFRNKYATSSYNLCHQQDPLDLLYSNFEGGVAIVPIERCRSHMLGFTANANPFIKMLQEYAENKSDYSGSILERYYNEFCPTSMQAVLKSNNTYLSKYHPMATVLPWSTSTPEAKLTSSCVDENAHKILSKEAYKLGLSEKDNYGWQFFGPVSKSLGLQEYLRLITVYTSIKNNGYRPEKHGNINGYFLISDNDWVWVNFGGKHRFASLVALKFKNIQVALKSKSCELLIRRTDVDYWPNVKNGLFSKPDALNIFDQILKGNSYHSLMNPK